MDTALRSVPHEAARVAWIDAAKGVSILLVTLYHASTFADEHGLRVNIVIGINDLLTPIRMPLFFCAAGLTAGSVLYGSWRALWSRRLSLYVWVFALWLAITSVFFSFVRHPRHPNSWPTTSDYFQNLAVPNNELWFLWCLAIFYVLAWIAIAYPKFLVFIGLSAALGGFVTGELTQSDASALPLVVRNALKYFMFFAAAASYRKQIMPMVNGGLVRTILSAAGYTSMAIASHFLDGTAVGGLIKLVAAIVGVFAVANVLVAVNASFPAIGNSFAWIGRRTLPIYLLQAPLLALVLYGFQPLVASRQSLEPVVPFLMVIAFVPIALAFDRLTQTTLTWLIRPPQWQFTSRGEVANAS